MQCAPFGARGAQLAKALRKGPFQTQVLMGGVDKRAEGKDDSSLFWLDYLGTLQKVTCFTAHSHSFCDGTHKMSQQCPPRPDLCRPVLLDRGSVDADASCWLCLSVVGYFHLP